MIVKVDIWQCRSCKHMRQERGAVVLILVFECFTTGVKAEDAKGTTVYYIRHYNGVLYIAAITTDLDKKDATFIMMKQ